MDQENCKEFKNRMYGCIVIKSINSNFNADFSGLPRTLPNGTIYATDKALKYTIKNYIKNNYPEEKVLYFRSFDNEIKPLSLGERYKEIFGEETFNNRNRSIIIKNLLTCIDVRLFGATFAVNENNKRDSKINLSVFGTVQISHAVNKYTENEIYTEDILSPFRNSDEKHTNDTMITIGNQFNVQECHYVYFLSVNPKNLEDITKHYNQDNQTVGRITERDIKILKEALCRSVTYYDSSKKIGSDNEVTILVTLKENSKKILPCLVDYINITKVETKTKIDCKLLSDCLNRIEKDIEKIEVYYSPETVIFENLEVNNKSIEYLNILEDIK